MEETNRLRAKKKIIRVIFPDGKIICYQSSTKTMIAVLSEIGSDRFPSINMTLCHMPLLSKEIYPEYREWMKPVCDGWYLNTQSGSENKFMQLRTINEQLSLGLVIELGTDFDVQKIPAQEKKIRTKDKLMVKFPDGECVANDHALETFLEAVGKIGVEDVMRKHITWGSTELITQTKKKNNQVQIGDNRWIVVPNTTKDKAKVLRVVAAMLRLKLEVTCFSASKKG